ncbi:MAG: tetratricopeptide repeat protein [Candidatus Aureabacteria bacterium]|nr:tetratricopeptide repeat protein [Candidatus Auribacterota bacterium]
MKKLKIIINRFSFSSEVMIFIIFLAFLLSCSSLAFSDDFDLGIKAYKDRIYVISLKYFNKFLEETQSRDIEKKILSQFYIAKIHMMGGNIREATQIIDIIVKKKKVLVKNGLYDAVLIMKAQSIAFFSGIDDSFAYIGKKRLKAKNKESWDIKLGIIKFLANLKGEEVIDEALLKYQGKFEEKTEALLYLMKVEQLLRNKKGHVALSLLSEKIEKEFEVIKKIPSLYSFYIFLNADAFYQTGEYGKAVEFYKQGLAFEDDPYIDKGTLIYKMGVSLWKKKDLNNSLKYLNEYLQEHDNQKDYASALNIVSQIYIELKDYEKAQDLLSAYIDPELKDKDYYRALYWLAEAHYGQNQFKEAIDIFENMMESNDEETSVIALYGKSWSFYMLHEYENAKNGFEELLNKDQSAKMELSTRLVLANIYYFLTDYEACNKALLELLKKESNKGNDKILYRLGVSYLTLRKYELAIGSFNKIIDKKDSTILREKAIYQISKAYFYQREFEQSINYSKKLIAEYPKSNMLLSAYLDVGHSYYNMFRYKEALDTYQYVIENAKNTYYKTKATYFIGWCYYLMGKESESVLVFQSFLKDFPQSSLSPDIQFWLGEHYYNKKRYQESLKSYKELFERYPDCSLVDDALFWGSKASLELGDEEASLFLLEKLIKEYIKSDLIPDAFIEKASILFAQKKYDFALSNLETVIKKYPNSYLIHDALIKKGIILNETGKYQYSLKVYEDVFIRMSQEKRSIDPEWIWQSAELYHKTGMDEQAVEKLMTLIYGNYDNEIFKKSILLAKDIFVTQKRYEDAIILLNKLLKEGKRINKILIRRDIRKLSSKIKERK